jgi:hypothetical protein
MGSERSRITGVRPITSAVMTMRALRYIQRLLMRTRQLEKSQPRPVEDQMDPGNRRELEEQVRDEARRYEADLRELART